MPVLLTILYGLAQVATPDHFGSWLPALSNLTGAVAMGAMFLWYLSKRDAGISSIAAEFRNKAVEMHNQAVEVIRDNTSSNREVVRAMAEFKGLLESMRPDRRDK